MTAPSSLSVARKFGEILQQALETMTESPFRTRVEELPGTSADGATEWWSYQAGAETPAAIAAGATATCWTLLGAAVLAAAGVDSDPETERSTFCELLTQAAGGVGQYLTACLHKEITFDSAGTVPEPAGGDRFAVLVTAPDGRECSLTFAIDLRLSNVLRSLSEPVSRPKAPATPVLPGAERPAAERPRNLDLLLDVELPVSVSFGRAKLQIKDVVKLASGSIVELNRHISEPVEVIVNNCVIARGEVVVVEGNYGVRIQEIMSPQERLRTLK